MQLVAKRSRQICVIEINEKNEGKEKTEPGGAMDQVYRGPGALAGVSVLGEVMVGTACGALYL